MVKSGEEQEVVIELMSVRNEAGDVPDCEIHGHSDAGALDVLRLFVDEGRGARICNGCLLRVKAHARNWNDQDWIPEWQTGKVNFLPDWIAWMLTRPVSIRQMLLKFPPQCIVRATRTLRIPAPGKCGIVTSYIDPCEASPEGSVTVRPHPHADIRAECDTRWLEVVGYWCGLTPDVISRMIGDPTA